MADETLMSLLKANLGMLSKLPENVEWLLADKLDAAIEQLEAKGIALDTSSADDREIIVSYASWLYRERNNSDNELPRSLRYMINNKQIRGGADG